MLLDVQHLSVVFAGARSTVTAVDDVSFQIAAGETLGLVGESGSGKSVTALSILRLLQPPGRITAGRVLFEEQDLLTLTEPEMRRIRGARISLIFQEPMTALNPVMRVGSPKLSRFMVRRRTKRSSAPSSSSTRCTSPTPRGAPATIRISSRGACASAS
jgi:ABC-type dipeptide/oligopeptide/nickel transport system ATPase component